MKTTILAKNAVRVTIGLFAAAILAVSLFSASKPVKLDQAAHTRILNQIVDGTESNGGKGKPNGKPRFMA